MRHTWLIILLLSFLNRTIASFFCLTYIFETSLSFFLNFRHDYNIINNSIIIEFPLRTNTIE